MATLGPETREAIRLLREHKSVEEVKVNWYEIAVKFTSGIRENWILHPRTSRRKQFQMPFPDSKLWGRNIPTFCEFQTRPFEDEYNELIRPHFKVQYVDIRRSGFFNTRIKIHELTEQMFNEGWIEPKYPVSVLKEDLHRVSISNIDTAAIGLNYVNAHPFNYNRQPGMHVLSNFIDNWGSIEDVPRYPLERAWRKKSTIYRCLCDMLARRKDFTRIELIRTLMGFTSKRYGPRFVSPVYYRSLIEKIFKLERPIILDPTPSYGSVALATALNDGQMYYEEDEIFSKIAVELGAFLKMPIQKYDGEQVDLVVFGTLKKMSLQEVMATITKYRGRATHILCCVDKADQNKITNITNPKRVIKALLNGVRTGEDCILVY